MKTDERGRLRLIKALRVKAKKRSASSITAIAYLQSAETEAAKAGLWRTMHKINAAKREAGYELAEKLDPKNAKAHRKARDLLERSR